MRKLTLTAGAGVIEAVALAAFGGAQAASIQVAQVGSDAAELAALMEDGEPLFVRDCAGCHGRDGQGSAGPTLAGDDFLSSNGAIIGQILEGNESHGMPAFYDRLTAHEIAAIATYVRNSWGNSYGVTLEATVQAYLP